MKLHHLVSILVLLALLLPASPAHAGGVVTVCDEAHLLAALAGGGTVTFACSGTIILTAEITISADTAIDGSGQGVTISGNNAVRVFTVNSGVTLNLAKLTIANGDAAVYDHGGAISNLGTLIVHHSTLSGNRAFSGGGIYNRGTLTVDDSTFSGNNAVWHGANGGGIYNDGGTSMVSNAIFIHNGAEEGGGGGIWNNNGVITVNNCTFSENAGLGGGGISNGGTMTVTNSVFNDNQAFYGGGGISNGGTLIVSNSTFFGNGAYGGQGGGIQNGLGILTVSNSTFSENSAGEGGSIYNYTGSTATLRNTINANNPSEASPQTDKQRSTV